MASNVPPIIQARIAFLERARDQLIERRNNLIILRDIENLYQAEVNFFALLCRNIAACESEYRPLVAQAYADIDEVRKDFEHVAVWRRYFRQIREQRIDDIRAIESPWQARWGFKIHKITQFADDLNFRLSHPIDDLFHYRLTQFFTYWFQLIIQFCLHDSPTDHRGLASSPTPSTLVTYRVGQGMFRHRFFSILTGRIETRIPSQEYIFLPGKSYDHEFLRYLHMYVEESINLGPNNFGSDEFVPYVSPSPLIRVWAPWRPTNSTQ